MSSNVIKGQFGKNKKPKINNNYKHLERMDDYDLMKVIIENSFRAGMCIENYMAVSGVNSNGSQQVLPHVRELYKRGTVDINP